MLHTSPKSRFGIMKFFFEKLKPKKLKQSKGGKTRRVEALTKKAMTD